MSSRGNKAGRQGTAKSDAKALRGSAAEQDVLPMASLDGQVSAPAKEEVFPIALGATVLSFLALVICFSKGYLLLYGDAVSHLGIARRIFDSREPGLSQLGGVWLPLPHLLMLPFVQRMEWWQNGLAGAWPSLLCYILGAAGFYKLARRMLSPAWAFAATVFYGLNPNLLYLSTTAMTEPLFLALLIWTVLLVMECCAAIGAGQRQRVTRRLVGLGLLLFGAVLTRYDGWVLAGAVWLIVSVVLWRRRDVARAVLPGYVMFTVLAAAGPLLWLGYNQHFYHDPLDFVRGPYSAAAIEKKTSPPGSKHYRGWHNPGWALLFYTRTAQVDAAFWETGFAVLAAALAGAWTAIRRGVEKTALLLWMPLFFYVYSIAYGSVPIFIPQLWPHSYYNSRYGMELLPALALYAMVAVAAFERWLATREGAGWGRMAPRVMQPVVLALCALNCVGMISNSRLVPVGTRYKLPLVLKEALVNATTRVPFERNLAHAMEDFTPGVPIMMDTSAHVGALQDAGIPLKETINDSEYYAWRAALNDPAHSAGYVVAFAGDPVANAVEEHPGDLEELTILCGTGQACARIYRSNVWGQVHLPSRPAATGP